KAHDLAPDNADIAILEGALARQQGKFDAALADFKRAAKADPKNLKALWLIAEVADQLRGPDAEKMKQESYQRILEVHPDNTATLVEYARSLAASGDGAKLSGALKTLSDQSA